MFVIRIDSLRSLYVSYKMGYIPMSKDTLSKLRQFTTRAAAERFLLKQEPALRLFGRIEEL